MPQITVDGIEVRVDGQLTILEAARHAGIDVPTLCFDPRFDFLGTCRLCCVEVEGETHAPIACRTIVRDGMRIAAHSAGIEAFRRTMLDWMAAHVRRDAMAREPDKELHRLLGRYGIDPRQSARRPIRLDRSHPYIGVDMAQCITCFRCVRICEQVQGEFVWHAVNRGPAIRIIPDSGSTLGESSCVGCGACVDTCPTGALTDRGDIRSDAIDKWTRTTCVYCGVGCEMEVGTAAGRVARVRPCNDAPVSKGHLCVKGRYAYSFTDSPKRQSRPLVREAGRWKEISWDEALDRCAGELQRISATYGPDSIGILGSARATNEENYLAQKFARIVLSTNNVDCCARVCHTPSAAAMKAMLGAGAATNSFDDIEQARTFLVFGANSLENHPIVGARIRQQVLRHGANLIVVDPRRTELARLAHIHLALRPGTNIPLLNALAHVIVTEGLVDLAFLQERVSEWEAFDTFVAQWRPERAAAICQVAEADIRAAARLYAQARPSMSFHGLGLTEHIQGTEGVMALMNLALLTGNIGRRGGGINPLRGQNNVQGAAHMGCDPGVLTGAVGIEERRGLFERVWGGPIPRSRGLNLLSMMDAAAAGRLKALWVIGYDILATLPNLHDARRSFRNLEFVVVQDLFLTRTAQAAAHIVLPVASVFEKDGTFLNSERRIQRVRKAVEPPQDVRTDWEIICALAELMGHGGQFHYSSVEDIWNEIRQVWPEAAGISYGRLDDHGLQWPCLTDDDPGTEILHVARFAHGKRAPLQRVDYVPTPERCSAEYPLLLSTGRNLYQFNAGTMTIQTRNTRLRPTDTLDVAPHDADRLGIASGTRVRVQSRYGSVTMTARVTDVVKEGQVFATFHDPRIALNRLIGPIRDRLVQTPEYKVTAVRVQGNS
jgi:formate dehydrogenase major subunit